MPSPLPEFAAWAIWIGGWWLCWRATRMGDRHGFGKLSMEVGRRVCVDENGDEVEVPIYARIRGSGAVVDGGVSEGDDDGGADVICRKEASDG